MFTIFEATATPTARKGRRACRTEPLAQRRTSARIATIYVAGPRSG